MKHKYVLLSIVFSVLFTTVSTAQWTDLSLPTDGNNVAVTHDGSKYYATTTLTGSAYGKFYVKTGTGSWNQVSTNLLFGSGFSLWCTSTGTLILTMQDYVMGSKVRIMRSTNDGSTWTCQDSINLVGGTHWFTEDGNGNLYLFNYSGQGTLLKSTDDGLTWSSVNSSKFRSLDAVGTDLFGIVYGSGKVSKSTDAGVTFTETPTTGQVNFFSPFWVEGGPNGNVYAFDNDGTDSLHKTSDGGTTWSEVGKMGRFGVDQGNRLFVNTQYSSTEEMWVSWDNGATFTNSTTGTGLSSNTSIKKFLSTNDKHMYIHTLASGTTNAFLRFDGPLSIQETIGKLNAKLVANRETGNIIVTIAENEKTVLEIYNTLGQAVHSSTLTNKTNSINFSEASGVYTFKLIGEKGNKLSGKFVF